MYRNDEWNGTEVLDQFGTVCFEGKKRGKSDRIPDVRRTTRNGGNAKKESLFFYVWFFGFGFKKRTPSIWKIPANERRKTDNHGGQTRLSGTSTDR